MLCRSPFTQWMTISVDVIVLKMKFSPWSRVTLNGRGFGLWGRRKLSSSMQSSLRSGRLSCPLLHAVCYKTALFSESLSSPLPVYLSHEDWSLKKLGEKTQIGSINHCCLELEDFYPPTPALKIRSNVYSKENHHVRSRQTKWVYTFKRTLNTKFLTG